jgi:hypothetical protein
VAEQLGTLPQPARAVRFARARAPPPARPTHARALPTAAASSRAPPSRPSNAPPAPPPSVPAPQVSLLQPPVLPARVEARARDALRRALGHVWRAREQQPGGQVRRRCACPRRARRRRRAPSSHPPPAPPAVAALQDLLNDARRGGRAAARVRRLESLLVRDVPRRAPRVGDGCVFMRARVVKSSNKLTARARPPPSPQSARSSPTRT